ncbi:hypothetical protein ACFVMC_33070 [Nocardia sp. NPDC127579]|uniref:hypothetical protein n=1 Tax=Nocardia sp. NPDC127579 TaxID=3345402 RepID=UPI00363FBFDE
MNAAAKPGLGDLSSTRPMSRAARRAEAERIRLEQERQAEAGGNGTAELDDQLDADIQLLHEPGEPTVQLPLKRAKRKVPIATQIRRETEARVEWAQARGAALTDLVDAALNAYLDAAGVPQPGPDGTVSEPA